MKKSTYLALCASTLLYAEAPAVKPLSQRTFSQSQFIPDISLIVDTSFAYRNKDQDGLGGLSIPGVVEDFFGQGETDGHEHTGYSSDNGFNINYAELVLSSNVDPSFRLDSVFHFGLDSVEIEELYFTNTTLIDGLRIRGGKILSNFTRFNSQHQHFWDFNEVPLVYKGFLGSEKLNELGLQFQYTLPLEEYVILGLEVSQGDNEKSFGNDTLTLSNAQEIKGADAPSLLVTYIKTSFDIGDTTIVPGFSYIHGQSRSLDAHDGHEVAFDGTSSLYNIELTLKHYFDSYSFLSWQSEWMRLEKKGDEYHLENNVLEVHDQKIEQEGYYSQLVYAHDQNLRVGVRYDSIYKNTYDFSEEALPPAPYKRYSAMGEYHFSEFSRLRLEYTHNSALFKEGVNGFEAENVDSVILSLNLAIGAHGAHDF